MRMHKAIIEDFVQLPSLTETQVEFIKFLEDTDLPINMITDLVRLARDTSLTEMKTILTKNRIWVKKLFLERHPELTEELKYLGGF